MSRLFWWAPFLHRLLQNPASQTSIPSDQSMDRFIFSRNFTSQSRPSNSSSSWWCSMSQQYWLYIRLLWLVWHGRHHRLQRLSGGSFHPAGHGHGLGSSGHNRNRQIWSTLGFHMVLPVPWCSWQRYAALSSRSLPSIFYQSQNRIHILCLGWLSAR